KYRRGASVKNQSSLCKCRKHNTFMKLHSFLCNTAQFFVQLKTKRGSVESIRGRGSCKGEPRESNQPGCLTRTRRRSRAGQFSRSLSVAAAAGVGRIRRRSILVSRVLRCTPELLAASVWFQPCCSRVCRI